MWSLLESQSPGHGPGHCSSWPFSDSRLGRKTGLTKSQLPSFGLWLSDPEGRGCVRAHPGTSSRSCSRLPSMTVSGSHGANDGRWGLTLSCQGQAPEGQACSGVQCPTHTGKHQAQCTIPGVPSASAALPRLQTTVDHMTLLLSYNSSGKV